MADPKKAEALRARRRELHDPVKHRARIAVQRAIKSGRLTRMACFCGETKVHAHHADYSKPLEVEWLCKRHHEERHHPVEV